MPGRSLEAVPEDSQDPLQQYLEPEERGAGEIETGTLVLVDEDTDHWAVVDSAAVDEIDQEGRVALFWRDFDGEEGVLSLEEGEAILTRAPRLDGDYGQPLPDED